jgi:hypothetical protein
VEQIDIEAKRYTERKLVYGGAVNPRDADLTVSESKDGKSLVFGGRKAFSTGSKISDLTILEGVLEVTLISFHVMYGSHHRYVVTLGYSDARLRCR